MFGTILVSHLMMIQTSTHILLADDDISLATVLADYLRSQDFVVDVVSDGRAALHACQSTHYDIMLLDINMPEMTGFQVLQSLTKAMNPIPVVVLSARNAREDIMRAFTLGCDDYVTKPFSMDILICRIRAILRRASQSTASRQTQFTLGTKHFDALHQTLDGEHLSGRESDLLLMLCQNMNQLVDRHRILQSLWRTDDCFSSRSLSVYANHLRTHLRDTGVQLIGVHGKGYKLLTE